MKTTEVNRKIIGRRCKCMFTALLTTGVIEDIEETTHSVSVKVRFDKPVQWGDDWYEYSWSWGRKCDDFGSLQYLELLPEPAYQTMVVTFKEPIDKLDAFFDDTATWGVGSLKEWVDSYETVRFTAISDRTAIITSEYNTDNVKEWLEKYMPVENIEFS